ncbi:MAG: AAA family ATPase [Candidatus Nanohaloarchaea archaeon]|nr:AAA family ATPase [Candidatus Nanohaloarchaea archaeon]
MEDEVIDKLVVNSKKQFDWAEQFKKHRYLYEELKDIDPSYYLGIKGVRGIGKTVLMLQIARETDDSIYFSADSTLVQPYDLYEVVKALERRGYENIFVDEIHRKAGWDQDVKTLYDEHQVRLIFSGSSAIDITKTGADLSRRVVMKRLKPASFREFLNLRKGYSIPPMSLETILENRKELSRKHADVHPLWKEYVRYGGVMYPKKGFFDAFENSLRKVVMQDLEALRQTNVKYETDAFKLLHLIARSPPFETNYSKIANDLDVSKNFAIRLVSDLEKAGVVKPVLPCKKKGVNVKKEPKIYLRTPVRKFFEHEGVDVKVGALREEFFANHAEEICYMKGGRGEKTADFRYKGTVIEVGGPGKSAYQDPEYIAVDGLSTEGKKIPLFLFGFLY